MPDLEAAKAALETLRAWPAFKAAFQWTSIFVLIDIIEGEVYRREREAKL